MKKLLPTLLNSPKNLFFVSLFLFMVGQMVDLQVLMSGAPQWQRVVSGLFFYILFPVLLYHRLYRAVLPVLSDRRLLHFMHCVAGFFGTILASQFITRLVAYSKPWPLLYLLLTVANVVLTITTVALLVRHFLRLMRTQP
ncbi:hypothetical protein [Klebsiella pneumoniae]|uniref:hypothetical protein n=1 Tax=Klebsiella pneumoniae TaxID=573 RepID=UPI00132F8690|nr:hypothetical protein [Klebsiella pneumoniae]